MKSLLLLLIGMGVALLGKAQYVYTIKADSVKITGASCDSAELIIQNHTQGVPGFLFNTGNGRTVFQKVLAKVNDTTYLIGLDTLKIAQPGNPVLLNPPSAQSGTVNLSGNVDLSGTLSTTANINTTANIDISGYGLMAVGNSYVTQNQISSLTVLSDSLGIFPSYGAASPSFYVRPSGVAYYTSDYGSLFTTRSLVDKGYVDSSVSHVPTLQSVTSNGNSTVNSISISSLSLNSGDNTDQIGYYANSHPVWAHYLINAQSGSNTGADYALSRYNDSGSPVDYPLIIQRSSGEVFLADGLSVAGTTTLQSLGAGFVQTSSSGVLSSTPYNPTWQTVLANGASATTAPKVTLTSGDAFTITGSAAGTNNLTDYKLVNDVANSGGLGIASSTYSQPTAHPSIGTSFTYLSGDGLALTSQGATPINFETNGLTRGLFASNGTFTAEYGLTASGAIAFSSLNSTGFLQTNTSGVVSTAALTSGQVTTALGYTPYNATNPSGYLTSTSAGTLYQPLENQRLSTTNNVQFNYQKLLGNDSVSGNVVVGNMLTVASTANITGAANISGSVNLANNTSYYIKSVQNTQQEAAYLSNTNRWYLANQAIQADSANVYIPALHTGFVQSNGAGQLSSVALTSAQVTTALGYTPSSATVTSGAYVPTLTVNANCSSPTADSCFYTRVGNIVTVTGHLYVTATTAGTSSSLLIATPINSSTTAHSAWGAVSNVSSSSIGAFIIGGPSFNEVQLTFQSTANANLLNYYFTFSYKVQ